MRPRTTTMLLAAIMALAAAPAQLAAQGHGHDMSHAHDDAGVAAPAPDAARLGGQAAFGTIAEVVRLLEADAGTDWRTVDLERLRAHLVDMDAVTLRSVVTREDVPNGARYLVRGDAATLAAAGRMLRAHAPTLHEERGWDAAVEEGDSLLRLTVTAPAGSPSSVARIRALGLVGLLATGEHHALHHVAIARGTMGAMGTAHAHE